jgi:hypothetical protein
MTKHDRIFAAVVARARALSARLRRIMADVRRTKARAEAELFRGRYHLASKNDDDLPIVHRSSPPQSKENHNV